MFKNRISVVSRARNGSKGNSLPSSGLDGNGSGNGDTASPSLTASLANGYVQRSVVSPGAVDELGAMEVSDPADEGVCVNESFFAIEDSGEVRENELLLDDDGDNDVTKDLDFTSNKPSPSLFSVTSNTPAARLTTTDREEIIGDVFTRNVIKEFDELSPHQSDTIETTMNVTSGAVPIPAPVFLVPQEPKTPHSANEWIVAETPQTVERLPGGQLGVGSASSTANNTRRGSIASAIHELNVMSSKLLQFIKSFEEKYSTTKR